MEIVDVTKSQFISFAYTVKALGNQTAAKESYDEVFRKFVSNGTVEYKVAELDPQGKLHYHGILVLPKNFYRKRLVTKGIHLKLVEVFNKAGWLRYIHKDVKEDTNDEEQIEIPNIQEELEAYRPYGH